MIKAKILVTGASGFIGKRLLYNLLEDGHEVYALSRIQGIGEIENNPRFHLLFGDLRDLSTMDPWPEDLDAAYYLVHSLGDIIQNLVEVEKNTANNFITSLKKTKCKQIIYLGGIIENIDELSPHLSSRLAVESILKDSKIPCTILRASIIIGAGSASFEIIRDLVEKLPIMIAPRWLKSYCQPISIADVLFYLNGILLKTSAFGQTYDIGGPEAMTFKEILLRYARFRDLKRWIIDVPFLTPRLSSYWLVFISSVKFSICYYLVESMRHSTRKLNLAIDTELPHKCLTYEECLENAFQHIAQNEVISTWMDAWDLKAVNANIQQYIQVPQEGCLKDVRKVSILVPIEEVKRRIWSIGGERGWYSMNWAWSLRGLMDKLVGGAGLNRGRRHPSELQIGDSLDFWRVIKADRKKGHLILFAEMKVPGEAWLEFEIEESTKTLIQTATFRPKGVLGRLYWYCLLPFHGIIFGKMSRTLAQDSFVL